MCAISDASLFKPWKMQLLRTRTHNCLCGCYQIPRHVLTTQFDSCPFDAQLLFGEPIGDRNQDTPLLIPRYDWIEGLSEQ